MRALVTGGAGFIGSHLVERLIELGHEVVCLDSFDDYYDPRLKRSNLASVLGSSHFRLVEGSILDDAVVGPLFADSFDVVVHLAARPGVRRSIREPGAYERINVQGTINLLELSRRHTVHHFVFASSSSVYGLTRTIPFREDDGHLSPVSPYGASKLAAEHFCHAFHHLYGLPVTCLRFFTVYGPRQRPDMAIHRFTRLIEEGKPIPIYGDGTTRRDYTYVDDIIDGIVRAIERPNRYQIYNLGTYETVTLRGLIANIEGALHKTAAILPQPDQAGDLPITYASIDRAAQKLGYTPRIKIDEGVRMFATWFRAHKAIPLMSIGGGA